MAKPKDLVMDLFGDYVRYMGGSIRVGQLTQLLELFDVEPATARVTLSRMRKEGWFETQRHGREISYQATDRLMKILEDGRERIFSKAQPIWVGRWTTVMFDPNVLGRVETKLLGNGLRWEGFAQLNANTWICPRDVREKIRSKYGSGDGVVFVANLWSGSLDEDKRLAETCWDLAGISEVYKNFIEHWKGELAVGVESLTAEQALVKRVGMVNEYRSFIYQDPIMPRALLPEDWYGDEAFSYLTEMHRDLGPMAMEAVGDVLFGGE
ncbi:phenylacetic acid-responsive transcriptional repressor [Corynebacterium suranareeae]|uniref:Phenylacetic acid-responsive transcriptional repressor n=1 Tax=Corynebacterium suranareeae TaxID=2506452 RepID=A0A160PRN8_9CORY|nr:PaaX family transcriptional regulator C-terminal domain-containing protein [Corynebacterium suranareeae]BAU96887.1 phenylacetic acid-responsive transcriptional repressor [Corynebacterium suranareeae]